MFMFALIMGSIQNYYQSGKSFKAVVLESVINFSLKPNSN